MTVCICEPFIISSTDGAVVEFSPATLGGPGSIPGQCIFFYIFTFVLLKL